MRRLLAFSIVLLLAIGLAASGGCRMCSSPYDYCGPVVDSNCCGCQGGCDAGPPMHDAQYHDGPYYDGGSMQDGAPVQSAPTTGPSSQRSPMPSAMRTTNR